MSSYTQSGSIRSHGSLSDEEITMRKMDNALGKWLKRHDAGACPRCGVKIKANSGLHCSSCFAIWQTEFGDPISPH
tara:strand:- start:620 stop:847 length:228 start_codon:yes stop_codon:yes gene_type:complete